MPESKTTRTLRMRQLPKSEYLLMKDMIDQYSLDDPSELFLILLRLGYDIVHMQDGRIDNGSAWITQIIAWYRDNPDEQRVYEL